MSPVLTAIRAATLPTPAPDQTTAGWDLMATAYRAMTERIPGGKQIVIRPRSIWPRARSWYGLRDPDTHYT